ncbi:MAG TPA: hypothetical protein VLJ39_05965 [Tepidisphaeraceae bacterium]|jgi:hypothetical protein|nr:hypothetical protein [Tepidisphaeraceae bacterium]
MLAKAVPSPWISVEVLFTLGLLLAGSALTFWALVRRWESHRQWNALADWGREHGFRSATVDPANLPPPLDSADARQPLVRLAMRSPTGLLIEWQTQALQQSDGTPGTTGRLLWHLLVCRLESAWHPTGLRPAGARVSALDLFSLSSFPTLGTTERFIVFGTDSAAARLLSGSMTRSLLPPDIGLLLHGKHLVLDFSERPFDEIEFNRMLTLAEQIIQKLPS